MNKADFVTSLAPKLEASKKDTERVLDAMIETLEEGLAADGVVSLTGVFTAKVVDRPAREGYNPKTGKRIQIEASTTVTMKAGKTLRDGVVGRIAAKASKKASKKVAKKS